MSSKLLKSREPEPKDNNSKEWRYHYVRHEILGGVGTELLNVAAKEGKDLDVLKKYIDDLLRESKSKKRKLV